MFICKGTVGSCGEAAKFLRRKFDKIGEQVSTAAQFLADELRRMDSHSQSPR
jgi:hypothetical protein